MRLSLERGARHTMAMCHRGGGTEHLSGWLENRDRVCGDAIHRPQGQERPGDLRGDIVQHKQKADPFHGRRGDVRFKAGAGFYGIFQGDTFASVLYAYEQIVKDCKVIGNIY